MSFLKPNLSDVEGDSWEELDAVELIQSAQSLRWLVWVCCFFSFEIHVSDMCGSVICVIAKSTWPNTMCKLEVVVQQLYNLANILQFNILQPTIDKDSQEMLASECPRIVVNPKPSLLGFRGTEVPQAAVMQLVLDDPIVKDIDPKTWAVPGFNASRAAVLPVANPNELSVAEKFRLAFLERDTRLAPKRAKNTRQHQRRAEREWVTTDIEAKALALASRANRCMNLRNL